MSNESVDYKKVVEHLLRMLSQEKNEFEIMKSATNNPNRYIELNAKIEQIKSIEQDINHLYDFYKGVLVNNE